MEDVPGRTCRRKLRLSDVAILICIGKRMTWISFVIKAEVMVAMLMSRANYAVYGYYVLGRKNKLTSLTYQSGQSKQQKM